MAELLALSTDTPIDEELQGKGYLEIQGSKARIKERMELDHNMSGTSLDTTNAACDGYHHQVTLQLLSAHPTDVPDGGGTLYALTSGGVYWATMNGTAVQYVRIV